MCKAEQQVSQSQLSPKCNQCHQILASYCCIICGIFHTPSDSEQIWHCEKGCFNCRIGMKGKKYKHCSKCNQCVLADSQHQCFDIQECCICLNKLNDSYDHVARFRCNHQVHEKCWDGKFVFCPYCRINIIGDDDTTQETNKDKKKHCNYNEDNCLARRDSELFYFHLCS